MSEKSPKRIFAQKGPNESLKFTLDLIWVAISQVFTTLLGIIVLPALTKSYSTEMFGIWVQVSVTVGLIVPLLTLQFGTAVVRFLAGEENKDERRRSLGSMLSAILIFGFLMFIIANLFAEQLSVFFFNSPAFTIFGRLTFLWTVIDALYIFFMAYLRARGKIKTLAVIQIILALSKMGAIVALGSLGIALEWVVVSMIAIEFIFLFGVIYLVTSEEGFPILNFKRINEFLSFSVPQIPAGILMWIINASDRYFITHFLSLSETGIYSSSNSLGGIITLFFAPISFVLFPAVSKAWEQNNKQKVRKYFEYSSKLFLTMAIPAAAGLAIMSQSLLEVLTTSDYLVGWELVFLISLATIFLGIYQTNEYIIYLVKQTKWIPIMIVAAAAASIGINAILIPSIGIMGAAISKIISYLLLATVVTLWARKAINYGLDLRYFIKVFAAASLMSLFLYFFKPNTIIMIILAIPAGIAIYLASLFLLKAFSRQDILLMQQTLRRMVPWLYKK